MTIKVNDDAGSMTDVLHYFGMPVGEFRTEWKNLTDDDKAQLRNGVGKCPKNGQPTGTLTY